MRALAEHHFGAGPSYCAGCRQAFGQPCPDCPYDTEAPRTADGAAAWLAGRSCLAVALGGFGAAVVRLDMAAALAVALAEGCGASVAPTLLRAVQDGLAAAEAARNDKEN